MSFATIILADGTDPLKGAPEASSPGAADGGNTGKQPQKPNPFAGAGAAYIMVASALLGVGLGYVIDASAGTRPLWTLVCFFGFMIAGTYHMIKEGRK